MKTYFCLFSLMFFLFACDSTKKAKTANVEKKPTDSTLVLTDSMAIPAELGFVDTIPSADSIVFVEPKNVLDYMTIEEKGMVDEINLLRADPQAYSRFVDGYIQTVVTNPLVDNETKRNVMASAGKLILELQTMEPLPALVPRYKLYQVAKMHGQDMVLMKAIDHLGSDGAHPFQRIHEGAEMDGSENLIVEHSSFRESILALMIGYGTGSSKAQNILDPQWEFIACYEVGTVGEVNNVWVQLFAFPSEEVEETEDVFEELNEEVEVAPIVLIEVTENEAIESVVESDFSFLTTEEKEMIDEINLLRSNPSGYISFVDAYSDKYEKQYLADDKDFQKAVEELKEELKTMKPIAQLQTHQALYNVAKAHGLDNKNNHQLEHVGSDKSDSFDRVSRSGLKNYIDSKGYFAPNENLVGGEDSPRESVVALLIDSGVSSRGHRKALLEPNWKYVACYKIGMIENLKELKGQEMDDMNNCWVQLFATD